MVNQKKLGIIGAGGFGREVLSSLRDEFYIMGRDINEDVVFFDNDIDLIGKKLMNIPVISLSEFNPNLYEVVVAVGDPITRMKIVETLPNETSYATIIHQSAILMDDCQIGEGSIITAGCILTCNIRIGKHSQLNLHTTIGHDTTIGDYFTSAPGVHISGECNIENKVYVGTNASIKQGLKIATGTTIGMGAVVVKNIKESGVYIGNPLRKLER